MSEDEGWKRHDGGCGKGDADNRIEDRDDYRAKYSKIFGKKKFNGIVMPDRTPKGMKNVGAVSDSQEIY